MKTFSGTRRVTFAQAFTLKGLAGQQPAGTYCIESQVKRSGVLPFFRSHRESTWIGIRRGSGLSGVLQSVQIDRADLVAALTRDAAISGAGR